MNFIKSLFSFLNINQAETWHHGFLPCIWVVVDPLDWQVNCHISNQNGQYFLSANIPYQKLHPWQLLAFYDDLVICIKELEIWYIHKKLIQNISQRKLTKLEYLLFFTRTCLREPLTIYSVTVARVPPAPSGTIP